MLKAMADRLAETLPERGMRNHALDGLRAIAASCIVFFHLGLANLHASLIDAGHAYAGRFIGGIGQSGVELFFTLSAVVLLRPYLRSARPMDVSKFLWRRCTRLWPAFFGAWLLAGAAVALISLHPTWWPSAMPAFSFRDWGAQVFIFYAGHNAYNFAWWTLTIEVMFYVLAPLLVAALAKRSEMTMTITFVSSILLALIAGTYTSTNGIYDILLKFMTFTSCFCGGLLLAKQDISATARTYLLVTGVAIVGASIVGIHTNGRAGYGLIYMAVVSHVLISQTRASRILSHPLLVWLGERSYSLFLTHYSVIALACWATSFFIEGKGLPYFLVSRVLALIGSLVVACILFEGVERRFAHGLVTAGMWLPWGRHPGALPARAGSGGAH
jgi:peptidoglycan/LPS O-acetylase OafA/YrhL